MFVDRAKIIIKSGKGGNGSVSFRREPFVPQGGPDGGDGGKGGDIVFVVDDHMATLLDFRYKKKYVAQNGEPGGSKKCFGKDGADTIIKVPRGTLIKDGETGALIHDMSDDEPFVAARGGRGGWGNAHFATPTRQAPRFAKPGLEGDERFIILELKLIADVGLVGFPNVGKSTLLSMISAARPKIANYHFTTLFPNLGVIYVDEGVSFVMADIPGLIEGAHEGVGLGHAFLRHVDRCRLLLHVVDIAGTDGRDPSDDLDKIDEELLKYSPELSERPQIVVANKVDSVDMDDERVQHFIRKCGWLDRQVIFVSAVTGENLDELVRATVKALEELLVELGRIAIIALYSYFKV